MRVSEPDRVREPAVAGSFYPGEAGELQTTVDDLLARAGRARGPLARTDATASAPRLWGLVSPHAGYRYSGPIAATGYQRLAGQDVDTVIVLAPSHRVDFPGASILDVDAYRTPLGLVPLSPLAASLRATAPFSSVPDADESEHSLEVQLPFLQRVLPSGFTLVPIVFGRVDARAVAEAVLPHVGPRTLVVASSDLSHYHPYGEAQALDHAAVEAIRGLDPDAIRSAEACGKHPILALVHLARMKGWKTEVLDYRNSGDTAGSKHQVVGYASVAFVDEG